jgi:hypothetical protein
MTSALRRNGTEANRRMKLLRSCCIGRAGGHQRETPRRDPAGRKLGLHIAFGRRDHFGGQVGPKDFSGPEAVIHIDRVYVPDTQPDVKVLTVDLNMPDGVVVVLMRDGEYAVGF